jgi:hypothetical protein
MLHQFGIQHLLLDFGVQCEGVADAMRGRVVVDVGEGCEQSLDFSMIVGE